MCAGPQSDSEPRLPRCPALGNSSFLLAFVQAHFFYAGRKRGEYSDTGDETTDWLFKADQHRPVHARTRRSQARSRAEDRKNDSLPAPEGEWRMKFWIRMWPHVAYRESLNESRSFVQALIDDLALELERLLA